jgi:hypothetical protein
LAISLSYITPMLQPQEEHALLLCSLLLGFGLDAYVAVGKDAGGGAAWVYVNSTQVYVNSTQVYVNSTQVYVNSTQVYAGPAGGDAVGAMHGPAVRQGAGNAAHAHVPAAHRGLAVQPHHGVRQLAGEINPRFSLAPRRRVGCVEVATVRE